MITITPTTAPTSGSVFVVEVTGHTGSVSVLAELDGDVLATEVISKGGKVKIKVKIPPGSRGKAIEISVADSNGVENGIVRFVGK